MNFIQRLQASSALGQFFLGLFITVCGLLGLFIVWYTNDPMPSYQVTSLFLASVLCLFSGQALALSAWVKSCEWKRRNYKKRS